MHPSPVPTLAESAKNGRLPALDRVRTRAQLAMVDTVTAANIRLATTLLLSRVREYYKAVNYTGPGYVFGRVDSEFPSALYAAPVHNYMDDTWIHQEMSPANPTCTAQRLFEEAGWLCLDTACRVAIHEITQEVPEAQVVLLQARYCIRSMCEDRKLSGINWRDARRRLRTPGVRKLLGRIGEMLPYARIGRGAVRPAVFLPDEGLVSAPYSNVTDWSFETLASAPTSGKKKV